MNFSTKVLAELQNAGWHENYQFDSGYFIDILKNNHYEVSDAAKKFLKKFGNLTIECDHPRVIGGVNILSTIIWEKLIPFISNNIQIFVNATGIQCCPVGRCMDEEMPLYISQDGKFYSMDSDACYLVGETVEQAFENLIHGREFQEICELEEIPFVYE